MKPLLIAAFALSAAPAWALPVTYLFTGTAEVTVGAAAFPGGFEIVATGDTDGISPAGGDFMFVSNLVTATLSVGDGALLTAFDEPIWVARTGEVLGLIADPIGDAANTALATVGPAFGGYDLDTDAGPVTTALSFTSLADGFSTAAGVAAFGGTGAVLTIEARVKEAVVPLPPGALLLPAALMAFAAARRRGGSGRG
ncbi:MAG: hypothetical protein AAGI51_18820 [Pseudomonadota bacterium]